MRTPISAFLALVIAVAPAGLRAQTVDTAIVGTVTDNSGAVLPGAKIGGGRSYGRIHRQLPASRLV